MKNPPQIELSRLRDIAWDQWDPIGLRSPSRSWREHQAPDEYDGYMLRLVGKIQHQEPDEEAARYLVQMETEHMGLRETSSTQERALATVRAVRAYVSGTA
jgi:hypothetical protein